MDSSPIYWALLAAVALGVLAFLYFEYQAAMLRTEVSGVPGGLRFSARAFTVEVRRPENTLQLTCLNGQCRIQSLDGGEEQTTTGPLTLSLPAAGMRIQVAQIVVPNDADVEPTPTGYSTIVLTASDEMSFDLQGKEGGSRSTIQLNRIPDPVARTFRHFSSGLEVWFQELEDALAAAIAAREQQKAMEAGQQAARAPPAAPTMALVPTPAAPPNPNESRR